MNDYIINTDRLVLRPITAKDAELIWPYVSDPEVSKDMSWDAHQNIEQTNKFIADVLVSMTQGRSITWCIFENNEFPLH